MSDSYKFSIQKFEAVEMHYMFRIEFNGEEQSWAVPKGPSPDPRVKRLAIPIQSDIPLDFEGVFGEGDKPKVIVWDSGSFVPYALDDQPLSIKEGLEVGNLSIWLKGKKLQGGFSFLRIDEGENERWFMMKIFDAKATSMRNPVITEPLSVVSGKSVEEID